MPTPAVTFNYDAWVGMFPEFGALPEPMAQGYFNRAGLYCANDTTNPAYPAGILPTLLDLVTAHLAWMSAPRDAAGVPAASGAPPNQLMGRISSAGEGSVNVSTEYNTSGSPSEAFFTQTTYGAQYWQATAQFRTFRYAAQPTVVAESIFPFVPSAVGPR